MQEFWSRLYYAPDASGEALNSWIEAFWGTWLCKDMIVFGLVVGMLFLFYKMSKREYWRLAAREIMHRKIAMISLAVLCVYGAIALLDSVGWHNAVRNVETGEIMKDTDGRIVRDRRGLSLLDRLFSDIRLSDEITYSAPLQAKQFTTQTHVTESGQVEKIYPDLKHPGKHLLGTERVGKDVFFMALKGIRTAIIIGLVATLLAIPFAILLGVLAGYCGGWIDDIIQYFYTVFASIPSVLLIVAFMMVWDRGLLQLCVVMGITSWVTLCRVLRGEALKLREMEFVQSARAMGVPPWRIMLRHILPNLMHVVLITAVLRFSGQVMNEAILTYLELGVDPQTPSWGRMINSARMELARDPEIWWQILAAFIAMIGLLLPANLFGDALRDALDPRLRTQ